MTTPAALPAATLRPARAAQPPAAPVLSRTVARRVLREATVLGISADALLRDAITGLALPLWIALVALALAATCWSEGRRLHRQAAGWLAAAVLFAATVAWRSAELLSLAGILAILGCLVMAAIAMHDPDAALLAARLRDTLWAAYRTVRRVAAGLLPIAFVEAIAPGEGAALGRRTGPAIRATVLAAVVVAVFGALLRGADPIFASLVALPDIDIGTIASHVIVAGFFAWLVGGWARAALDETPSPATPTAAAFALGATELTAVLGALNALFVLFLVAQLGWFFGGEHFLREHTGLTAAEYARQGFFQMVWVVMLVVPLLLATRALLRDDAALQRRHTALSLPLIGLLAVMVLSAFSRMRLYVQYFGLTTDRFYPMVFMAWLVVVLLWFALTVLRGRGHRFVAGAVLSALATLFVVELVAPDTIIARVNIARGSGGVAHPLDLTHLARLSGEATPLAIQAVLRSPHAAAVQPADRCNAASTLITRWGPESSTASSYREPGAWRRWNAGEASALRAVADNAPALRAVRHATCARGADNWKPTYPGDLD